MSDRPTYTISIQERVALFIDGANTHSATRGLGFEIDYKKLLDYFGNNCLLVRALYYTALPVDREVSPLRPLVDWLDYNGYMVVTKTAKEYTDNRGNVRMKGNMDIEIAVDMLELADRVDHIVLLSGDGDFKCLIAAAQRKGCRVTVVSTLLTTQPILADELRRQADKFLELGTIRPSIERGHR
jgi:uncharacterized LabA/DUF88 family protein